MDSDSRSVGGDESRAEDSSPLWGTLEIVRIDNDHWVLHDHTFRASDAEHLVACLSEIDNGIDVVWVAKNIPLPTRYRDVADVVDDFMRWRRGSRPPTRPVPIAHLPPLSAGF